MSKISSNFLLFCYSSVLYLFCFISGCASLYGPGLTSPPYTNDEINRIIDAISEQEERVKSFYSVGSLRARDQRWEIEANTLIAGIREPLRIKIELTHTWGKPLIHILIANNRLEIFSYQENRLYYGKYTAEALSRFLPMRLNPKLIWTVLKGYPQILGHDSVISPKRGRISLLDINGKELETINLHPENGLPESVFFPTMEISMEFDEYYGYEGSYAAREVRVTSDNARSGIILKNSRIFFNGKIPEKIFSISKPSTYETVDLDKGS